MKKLNKSSKDTSTTLNTNIISAGKLSASKWPGSISVNELINNGTYTTEQIKDAKQKINNYYVNVNSGAKTRCIDGRHDPKINNDNIGPQVPGGAPGAALAYRLGVDKDDLTKGSYLQDANDMIKRFLRIGLAPGGHRDELNNDTQTSKVGCGAIDSMDVILATMLEPKLVDDHKRIVRDLLREDFIRDIYLRNLGAATVLNGQSERYFRGRQEVLNILETNQKGSVATLSGSHQEVFVIINFVPNTTFASNKFSKENNGIQAFGYDVWRSKQIAELLLPRPEQATDRSNFIIARVMYTIATLMALTDGSQELFYRVKYEQQTGNL